MPELLPKQSKPTKGPIINSQQDFEEALLGLGLKNTSEEYNSNNANNNIHYEKHPVYVLFREESQIEGVEFDGCVNRLTNPRFEFIASRHKDTRILKFQNVYKLITSQMKTNHAQETISNG